ncbi:MAG TPA: urease accessory UreF family protein [Steroidobacteraceae bacterium]|jgi:urease accessory protein|nr:urease accessory UreF family protein [Steroidobacteraceae bacterium]
MDSPPSQSITTQFQLLAWCSPAYPTGAFSYSHGMEWAVERGTVTTRADLLDFIGAVLERGGGWVDAVLFAHAWRAAQQPLLLWNRSARAQLLELAQLAAAFRATSETALESCQQGTAFLDVTLNAWPHPRLAQFASDMRGRRIAQCVAVAVTCAAHDVALTPALHAFVQVLAANLVSAGARLIPLGQTDAQIAVARLAPVVAATAQRALVADLDDLGTSAPTLELCSMRHETQYTRLFRS